jgi:ribosomal protein S18 acetylase RimI-like enzyme
MDVTAGVEIERLGALSPADARELAAVLVDVVNDGASVGFLPPLARAEAERYWRSLPLDQVILFVARSGGVIVGTVHARLAPLPNARHRAEIAKLMVRTDARRRGIANALMRAVEAACREAGRTLLHLDTRDGDAANELYRSLGYVEAGRIPRYARNPDGTLLTTVLYYKEL